MDNFYKKFWGAFIGSAITIVVWYMVGEIFPDLAIATAEAAGYAWFVCIGCIIALIIYVVVCVFGKVENAVTSSKYNSYFKKTIAEVDEENVKVLFTLSTKDIQKGEKLVDNSGKFVKKISSLKDIANRIVAEGDAELALAIDKSKLLPYKVLKIHETGDKVFVKTTYNELNRCLEMKEEAFLKYKKITQDSVKMYL